MRTSRDSDDLMIAGVGDVLGRGGRFIAAGVLALAAFEALTTIGTFSTVGTFSAGGTFGTAGTLGTFFVAMSIAP
jgi:hypothetical protein